MPSMLSTASAPIEADSPNEMKGLAHAPTSAVATARSENSPARNQMRRVTRRRTHCSRRRHVAGPLAFAACLPKNLGDVVAREAVIERRARDERAVPKPISDASMIGTTFPWLPVISRMMTKAVIGAWTTPAKYPAIPRSRRGPCRRRARDDRRAEAGPDRNDGAKMPPGMPEIIETRPLRTSRERRRREAARPRRRSGPPRIPCRRSRRSRQGRSARRRGRSRWRRRRCVGRAPGSSRGCGAWRPALRR